MTDTPNLPKINSPHVRPLSELVKETEDAAVEAAWEGDTEQADRLMSQVEDYRERIALGEIYECMF